uniref:Abscisic insensitive 1B n=1 Tax=Rhizophora mucronata TaxID=61149 RepID=A0A2P2JP46_RHIMU
MEALSLVVKIDGEKLLPIVFLR